MKTFFTLLFSILLLPFAQAQTIKPVWSVCGEDISPIPSDMSVDPEGNSYVTGYFDDTSSDNYLLHHFFLQKTNARGVVQWLKYFPVSDSFSAGRAVATDHLGNVYVTGERYDTACNICTIQIPLSYLFTIKYDALGNVVWINRYDGPKETNQSSTEISVTPDGLVYVVANEKKYDPPQGRYFNKMVTQKIFRNGNTAWIRKDPEAVGNGINYDKDDNVLVAASYSPSGLYQLNKFYVVKYGRSGATLWTRTMNEYQKSGNAYFIYADTAGNIYVNGQTDTIAFYTNPKIATAKYTPDGNLVWWKKEIDGTKTLPNFYGNYTIDPAGNSYITGYRRITDIDRDYLTVKRNPAGTLLWSNQYSDVLHAPSIPLGIGIDNNKNVSVTGYSYTNPRYSTVTIQYDVNGVQKWIKTYNSSRNSNNFPIGLGLDKIGNVYVAGGGVCTVKYGEKQQPAPLEKMVLKPRSDFQFTISPNPCNDVLNIRAEFLSVAKYKYTIYDNTGRIVLSPVSIRTSEKSNTAIDVKSLHPGMYLIQLTNGKSTHMQKFIKL